MHEAHNSSWLIGEFFKYLSISFLYQLILGDSGYPLEPWLLTPIENADINTPEGQYTQAHIKARNCIERCFGVLKQRFRCLLKHRILHYDPVRAAKIIYSCVVLHNISCRDRVPQPVDEIDVHYIHQYNDQVLPSNFFF